MTLVLLMVAAAVGAPLRYAVNQAVQHRWPGAFPAGTLTVNLSGSFLLGCSPVWPRTTGCRRRR